MLGRGRFMSDQRRIARPGTQSATSPSSAGGVPGILASHTPMQSRAGCIPLMVEIFEGYSKDNARTVVDVVQSYRINVLSDPRVDFLRYRIWFNPEGTKIEDVNGVRWDTNRIQARPIEGLPPRGITKSIECKGTILS